jgi:4-hydroxy-tetrahydrodipicolinate synthase
MFKGSYPALVTPFKNGAVDFDALKKLVDWHVAEGSHGLVPVGTTGESPTLSHAEHGQVIEVVVVKPPPEAASRSSPEPGRTTPPRGST